MFEAIQNLAALTRRLDAVRPVSAKLIKHDPGGGADALVTVLEEVSKTFIGFEIVLVRYLSLRFDASTRDRDQTELIFLEGGGARTMVGEFRARCHKIGSLYRSELANWFAASPISPEEKHELDQLFYELQDSDENVMIPAVDELVTWLEQEVSKTSALVGVGRFKEAADCVLAARRALAPLRRTVGRLVGELRDLEIQFTA
jgi:hypothetical protein